MTTVQGIRRVVHILVEPCSDLFQISPHIRRPVGDGLDFARLCGRRRRIWAPETLGIALVEAVLT